MDKSILFIEDEMDDFVFFSEIMKEHGFFIYPQNIQTQHELTNFLCSHNNDYKELKCNIFNYIIQYKLYENKISMILLDINLLGEDDKGELDEYGMRLLSDFRNEFYSFYKNIKGESKCLESWSKSIPVIVLTIFDDEKCKNFKQMHGILSEALNKDEVKGEKNRLIAALNNAEGLKEAIVKHTTQTNITNQIKNINVQVTGNGNNIPINNISQITGDVNIDQSYNTLEYELTKQGVKPEDIKTLIQIINEEKQKPDDNIFQQNMKIWWDKVKSYAKYFSINILERLLNISRLLSSEQISFFINAING